MPCVCGKGFSTEVCCGRFLDQGLWPETAEELMRSRYTAFATRHVEYLKETHTQGVSADYQQPQELVWEKLEILDTVAGGPEDEEGIVEFRASFRPRPGAALGVHHERSRFHRIEGRWYYVDAETPSPRPQVREAPKVGRNDPCPCGSGKKFKKCCGA